MKTQPAFFCRRLALLLAVLFLSLPLRLIAQEVRWINKTPEGRLFTKTLEVKGGSINIEGGLMVAPAPLGFKDMFGKSRMNNPGAVFKVGSGIGIRAENHSTGKVFLAIEVKDPGEKSLSQNWELKPNYIAWHLWQPKRIQWNVPYPVTVTAYSDEEHQTVLGTFTTSWVFKEDDRNRFEDAKKTAEDAFRHGDVVGILICGWPEKASPQQLEAAQKAKDAEKPPPFEWKEDEGSAGATLTAVERRRSSKQGITLVEYDLRATGFAPAGGLTLWIKWLDGTYFHFSDISVDPTGLLKATYQGKSAEFHSTVVGMAAGEPISWALASADKRAYARAVVSPIEARAHEGCSGSAELRSPSGLLFSLLFRGFTPGEEVQISSEIGHDKKSNPSHSNDKGELTFPVLFSQGDHGKAKATATGKNCTITVEYKVGPEALAKK